MVPAELDELINWNLYGAFIRNRRVRAGFKTAEQFAEHLTKTTGMKASRDIIYKLEQGRQVPTATQFICLNIAVYNSVMPKEVMLCMSPEMQALIEKV